MARPKGTTKRYKKVKVGVRIDPLINWVLQMEARFTGRTQNEIVEDGIYLRIASQDDATEDK